jgi:cyclophilin family peptidyl-prolyl cis-trans isomerase
MSVKMKTTFRRSSAALSAGVVALTLAACGGGSSGTPTVTNLVANNVAYARTMTVSVNGAGLTDSDLNLTIDAGRCTGVARSTAVSDAQASFTCRVDSIGRITAVVRLGSSDELARVSVEVPAPQVSFTITDGARSGNFTVELDPVAAPITVRNFMDYVVAGFYTQTIIHRVLPGRIIQGGGYNVERVFKPPLAAPITLESLNGLKNLRGTIAMARTDLPDTATSQYYINAVDNPAFDADGPGTGYAVFGRVISGLDVVDIASRVPVVTLSNEFSSIPATQITVTAVVQIR